MAMDSTSNKSHKVEFSVDDISCTACHREINIIKQGSICQHPILQVLICKKCYKWYKSGEIEKGEDGADLQCRWCGDGGDVFCCNNCSNVFCKDCIKTNLGKEELNVVESTDKWCCYVCDGSPLSSLVEKCEKLQKSLKDGDQVVVNDEDLLPEKSPNFELLDLLDVNDMKLELPKRGSVLENMKSFELCVSALAPVSRTLSNSLSYAVSQVKKLDLSDKALAVNKMEEICSKINLNFSNLLIAFMKAKSSSRSNITVNSKKTAPKKESLKNGTRTESKKRCTENGDTSSGETCEETNNAEVEKVVENPRIKLTISKKSLNVTVNHDDDPAVEEGEQPNEGGENEEEEEDGGNDDESDSKSESEKEEGAESESSSGDEYNPKKDIREEKELSRLRRRDKMKHHKNKAAKRSLQKIKEKLRLKKLKVQLEKSKKGSKSDDLSKNVGDDDDDDDDDEEDDGDGEVDGSQKKNSKDKKHKKNGKGEKEGGEKYDKKEKDGTLKKNKEKKHKKNEGDEEEKDDDDDGEEEEEKNGSPKKNSKEKKHKKNKDDDDDEHFSSRKKKFLDKKLQRFQKSKHEDGSSDENDDVDDKNDDEDEIDKDIRDINRMLKQKFKKKTSSKARRNSDDKADNPDDAIEGGDNDCDESLKEDGEDISDSPAAEGDEDDNNEEKQLGESSGAKKKKKSLVSQDLFDDSSSNKGDDDDDDGDNNKDDNGEVNEGDGDDDDDDIEMKGDCLNSSIMDASMDENQFQLDEDMEDDNEPCGEDAYGDDLNDSIIDKVIEHCGSKKKKFGDKKKLVSGESKGGLSKSDVDEVGSSVDSNERKSKKRKRDRLLAASLLSSDDDDQFASEKNEGKKKKKGGSLKEDDGEEVVQKKKRSRKKKSNDDDDDDDDDEEGLKALLNESDEDGRKKKRRRIKVESSSDDNKKSDDDDDDDSSGDDFQSPSSGKKRKKIHKIITTKKLSKQTIDAAKAEEERRKRIEERQKLFNQVIVEDSTSPTKCPITTKLVLEIDPETKEPLIEVHKKVICKLKPHQVEAVKFMWNCCVESLEMLKKEEGSGCILAHCMGLGKTLSVISFVHTMLRHKKLTKLTTCLVLTPLNTILNWESEFDRWLKGAQPLDVYEMSTVKDNWSRSEVIKSWKEGGGILIMGYDMFRTLSQLTRVKNKKQKTIITEGLLDPGPDIVVCDEGHILKNDATGLSKACNKIKTLRRIVLTGTPLQNNLVEYHCMVTFVKPSLLGTRKEFLNRFVNPITNGQCSDSTPRDVKIMKNRAHVLHETLSGCVQRKDYSALTKFLLPKNEYVISIRLSKVQVELYQAYLNRTNSKDPVLGPIRGSRIFTDYQNLMKIWTHPWVLKLDEIRQETRRMFKDDADSFIDDSDEESIMDTEESGPDAPSGSEDDWRPKRKTRSSAVDNKNTEAVPKKPKKKAKLTGSSNEDENDEEKEEGKEVVSGWKSKSRRGEVDPDSIKEEEKEEDDKDDKISCEWWADYLKSEDEYDVSISGKLILLAEILKLCESIGDKVLLFSQSLLSLDLIERFLSHWDKHTSDDPDKQMAGTQGWDKGVDYIRMDGSTSAQHRKDWTEMFNDETNLKVRLFLISTKAGSLGINLVAANRVIIFDASWNPTHDVQSIFRVYRFGQTKPVYVYRFLAQGTMEEKIYERQVMKQSLAQRVIDEHQIERHFTSADLRELYTFKPDIYDPSNKNPTPKLPQDRLLAELLTDHEQWIVQYHEHDSLLENRPEEELTEDERKAAWEEYEMEKKGLLIRQQNNVFASNMNLMGAMAGDMYPSNSYISEVQKFIHTLYLQNPGMTQEELNDKAKLFMHYQMTQQQRNYIQAQQRERERLMRLHEEALARQRLAKLQNMGPITIDEELPQSSASGSKL